MLEARNSSLQMFYRRETEILWVNSRLDREIVEIQSQHGQHLQVACGSYIFDRLYGHTGIDRLD